ncbi:MAG: hypothetical protein ACRD0Q_11760 [Acidimicrobiales bacterium]
MTETTDPTSPQGDGATSTPRPGSRLRSGLIAGGAALGMTLAGLGVAAAQTDGPTTTTKAPATADGPRGPRLGAPGGHGPGGRPGIGFAMGGIHGEFTTKAPGGGYQTMATQRGEATAVSASSITVKSEDGFSRTYTVDDNTLVNAGNSGIDDVKTGDQVGVMAVVKDGKASAVAIHDGTQIGAIRDRWAPGRPKAPDTPN